MSIVRISHVLNFFLHRDIHDSQGPLRGSLKYSAGYEIA